MLKKTIKHDEVNNLEFKGNIPINIFNYQKDNLPLEEYTNEKGITYERVKDSEGIFYRLADQLSKKNVFDLEFEAALQIIFDINTERAVINNNSNIAPPEIDMEQAKKQVSQLISVLPPKEYKKAFEVFNQAMQEPYKFSKQLGEKLIDHRRTTEQEKAKPQVETEKKEQQDKIVKESKAVPVFAELEVVETKVETDDNISWAVKNFIIKKAGQGTAGAIVIDEKEIIEFLRDEVGKIEDSYSVSFSAEEIEHAKTKKLEEEIKAFIKYDLVKPQQKNILIQKVLYPIERKLDSLTELINYGEWGVLGKMKRTTEPDAAKKAPNQMAKPNLDNKENSDASVKNGINKKGEKKVQDKGEANPS